MARTKSHFVVLEVAPDGISFQFVEGGFADTKHAQRYLREHGKDDQTYRIATFRGGPVTVKATLVTRRKLVDAPRPAAPTAAKKR